MSTFFFDDDANLEIFSTEKIAIIGYGNQGRSQCLNLKDSGVDVILGNIEDEYADRARSEGWEVNSIPDAVKQADMVILLIPDDVHKEVYDRDIKHNLKRGGALCFAHGYSIYYGYVEPPSNIDIIMVAPRMLGKGVRDTYLSGQGFPSFVAVHQDYTGKAKERMLAIAKGIGSTRMGALLSTFEEETVIDLFSEHQSSLYAIRTEMEVLIEAGYSPEAVILDLYASGEGIEWSRGAVELGLFERMRLASPTAQFGHQVWGKKYFKETNTRDHLEEILKHIQNGDFAEDWYSEQQANFPRLKRVWRSNQEHPLAQAERKLYKILGRIEDENEIPPLPKFG